MRLLTTLFFGSLAAVTMAEWDKYADERAQDLKPKEPTSQDAEWEKAHGGAAPTYTATIDWLNDELANAVKRTVAAAPTDVPIPAIPDSVTDALEPALSSEDHLDAVLERRDNEAVDINSEEWAKENGYLPLSRRDTAPINDNTDIDAAAWALANGYDPLTKRDEGIDNLAEENDLPPLDKRDAPPAPPSLDPTSHEFAVENGYLPLGKRETVDDPDSDEFAVANGYTPLNKRDAGVDPESEEFAIANGYLPLSRRGQTPATKTIRGALFDWVKNMGGRRPKPYKHV